MARKKLRLISLPTCLNAVLLTVKVEGQVDQLEDRYLGMVEASGSNPDLSILTAFMQFNTLGIFIMSKSCQKQKVFLTPELSSLNIERRKMYEMIEMVAMAFTLGLTGALAPGPTLVATVNSSLKSGWTAGPKIALGHALVEVLIFLLIAGGLALAAQQYSHYIAWAGGLALMAFGILTVKGEQERQHDTPKRAGHRQSLPSWNTNQRRQSVLLDLVALHRKRYGDRRPGGRLDHGKSLHDRSLDG